LDARMIAKLEEIQRSQRIQISGSHNHRAKPRRAWRDVVSLTVASWNRVAGWFRRWERLLRAG
jgi:hypothetical protein